MTANIEGDLSFEGSQFAEKLDLERIYVKKSVFLRRARLTELGLNGANVSIDILLNNVEVNGILEMDTASVGAHVNIRDAKLSDAKLAAIKIGGNLDLDGSRISSSLDLDTASIGSHLLMRKVQLGKVNIDGARITGMIVLDESRSEQPLSMNTTAIGTHLFLTNGNFHEINFEGAKIVGVVGLDGARISTLRFDSASIGSHFHAQQAEFLNVDGRLAKIGGNFDLFKAKVTNELNITSMMVGANIILTETKLGNCLILYAKVEGLVDLTNAEISSTLDMESAIIGSTLFLRDTQLTQRADLSYLAVGNLLLSGAKLTSIDLTGSNIKGQLTLSDPTAASSWSGDKRLDLRNATAGLIQGRVGAWPEALDLRGFQYQGLGGLSSTPDDMLQYSVADFVNWINLSKPYSPQPYEYLAQLLTKNGRIDHSREILFTAREHERKQATGLEWVFKTGSLMFIGHSHRLYYILVWIGVFVVIGAIVIAISGERSRLNLGSGLAFSFDRLIPLVKLEESHYKVDLSPRVRQYFYFHQIMGYIFGSFLVAWLGGILK